MVEEKAQNKEKDTIEQNLSEKYIPKSKLGDLPVSNEIDAKLKKEMDKTKQGIEKFKKEITKQFKFVEGIGIVPAQASKKIEEEYEVPVEDCKKGLIHIVTIIPEEKFKEIQKVRLECIKIAKEINDKLWVHVLTPVDVWNLCLDSKFDIVEAIGMSYPILDSGIFGALRVASIHRSLVLRKFEKYITTYCIAGSMVTGTASKTSDVDVAIIIDDTDVKRMPRLELREKLRSIIHQYIQDATAMAGVKNILNVQVWLLTEFWDGVKDAHPVFFTFLRDGVPLYDRGTFLPWKSLLRMGKIKPSPEAIDMFMSAGDRLKDNVDRRLLDIALIDLYGGVLTPTQGLLMLFGISVPTPKETVKKVREVLQDKEKLLEKKYVDILDRVISFYKGYEHQKVKSISGTDLDKMAKDAFDYIARLKELRQQIEKRVQENTIEQVYKDVFGMLEGMMKKKSESAMIKEFEEKLVKEGRLPHRFIEYLRFIAKVKKDLHEDKEKAKKTKKKDKMTGKEFLEVEKARKFASEIINTLMEYNQRCDFLSMDRTRFIIDGKRKAEVFFLEDVFVIEQNNVFIVKNKKLEKASIEELNKQLAEKRGKSSKIDSKAMEALKKEFGDFNLSY